ncbi:MAG: acetate--CoA ligase [Ignavibacteriales bacterium]|nr:MAG: acetate--CoA ligase [Ignavibacteriaceae bacterium]MBW7872126.1 acetate--CoA ligase [Ignavibacteria bacterium]MCZ2143760.1 acetate--CoA ligase [Ignavibacteriales bacterium]WKZ73719.1 MAG: acetate--CoA ligase [Ignavibacteriaceae bacterium]
MNDNKLKKRIIRMNSSLKKVYHPMKEFSDRAVVKTLDEYKKLYKESVLNPEGFWGNVADELHWFKYWKHIREGSTYESKWFVGAKTNISYNCLDRHLSTPERNKAAIIWEGEPGETRTLTYLQLHSEVSKFSNVLLAKGVKKGDRVVIYMGMVPEMAIAMLACARIGATHSVVFAGFSPEALKDRILELKAKIVIASDLAVRRGSNIYLKPAVDAALESCQDVSTVILFRRLHESSVKIVNGRDFWWHDLMAEASDNCDAAHLDSEHPLFILFTSGTMGKAKGIIHTTAGYMTAAYYSFKLVFDIQPTDVYWCTADFGFATGHTYGLYAPLLNGVTMLMYEGAPVTPQPDVMWKLIDKHKVSIFFTAPTYVKNLMRMGEGWVSKYDLSSLRVLALGGEPVNPKVWFWFYKMVGKERCPIIDAWWQTETGSFMLASIPGVTPLKPGSVTLPLPGILAEVVDKNGHRVKTGENGFLVLKDSWPSIARGIWGNKKRYKEDYWAGFGGDFFTGDGARKDKDGYFWILGRVDDVVTVSGNRISTLEIENALHTHKDVAEVAVIGRPDDLKGNSIVAFITLKEGANASLLLKEEMRNHVMVEIGHIARPDEIRFTEALPKTRNGKIVRRLLREIASGGVVLGDLSSIENISALEFLRELEEEF